MRIETVINAPRDLGCNARLPNLAELQDKARAVNRAHTGNRTCRPGHRPCESSLRADRAAVRHRGRAEDPGSPIRRSSGQALAGALCSTLLAATGITSKSLRALMTGLLARPYTPAR